MENRLPTDISKGCFIPDIFHASFCGHNISFVVDTRAPKVNGQYQVVILNESPNKYRISYQNGYQQPKSFLITDDKGINYEFTGYREFQWPDSYYLTKVYGPDGADGKNVMTFEYTHKRLTAAGSRPNVKKSVSDRKILQNKSDLGKVKDFVSYNIEVRQTEWMEITPNEGCEKYYPSKITTPSETIEFTLDSLREDLKGACSISDIVVKSVDGKKTKAIHMKYGYYKEKTIKNSPYTGKRLRLDGVSINDQNYLMEYDQCQLPSFGSYSKDYWGYYNGADNSSLCASPKYVLNNNEIKETESLGKSNRFASAGQCKVGVLKKITYPTGGYTTFEFESNRFNDEYYYPDASFSYKDYVTTNHGSLSFYGASNGKGEYGMSQSKKFKFTTPTSLTIDVSIQSLGTDDFVDIIVKDASGKEVKTLNIEGARKSVSEKMTVSLTPNQEYTVVVNNKATKQTACTAAGSCRFVSENLNPIAPTKDEDGGYSIGGGLRIKSIMNYDAPQEGTATGNLLHGKQYEYKGGKLLIPTVRVSEHYINYVATEIQYVYSSGVAKLDSRDILVDFRNINAEPAYIEICSLGIPSTVGYDKVVAKEIGPKSIVRRTKVSEYYNYKYEMDNSMNARSGNAYFSHPYGYMNGKIKKEYIYSGTDTLVYAMDYSYHHDRLGSILFPKSIPCFFGIDGVGVSGGKFNVTMYRHYNIWCRLGGKTEKRYDGQGKLLSSTNTTYIYNSYNHQVAQQTVANSVDSLRTSYWYPSDKKVTGYSNLVNSHNISEVMAVDTYRNGVYTGGSKYVYTMDAGIPVVNRCYSILPNKDCITEMNVTSYDGHGNIREYRKKDGTPVTIIWSYNHQLPILEIVGCTYGEACAAATSLASLESAPSVSETAMTSLHSTLMNGLHDALVTAYTYSPWRSVSQSIKPNGEKTVYSYDEYGRLQIVLDANQSNYRPLQEYNYNYKNK